jgi:hypothetical protein
MPCSYDGCSCRPQYPVLACGPGRGIDQSSIPVKPVLWWSQDGTTVTTACFTMRRMAHLVPHTVLPLVCKRFEVRSTVTVEVFAYARSIQVSPRGHMCQVLNFGVSPLSWSHFRSLSYCPDRHVNALLAAQAALEAVTASQQLVPAIFALAMITRPLMAVGLPPPEGEGMDLDVDVDNGAAKAEAQVRPASHQLSRTD